MSSNRPNPLVNELYRRLRELWIADFEAILRRIDPALLSGTLTPGALPRNTMINRGTYNSATRYRPGDVVVDSGGAAYVNVAASSGIAPGDEDYWQPLGGGTVPPPPDALVYIVDSDDAYLLDSDGRYLYEAAS